MIFGVILLLLMRTLIVRAKNITRYFWLFLYEWSMVYSWFKWIKCIVEYVLHLCIHHIFVYLRNKSYTIFTRKYNLRMIKLDETCFSKKLRDVICNYVENTSYDVWYFKRRLRDMHYHEVHLIYWPSVQIWNCQQGAKKTCWIRNI